jgi:hypothetical protein
VTPATPLPPLHAEHPAGATAHRHDGRQATVYAPSRPVEHPVGLFLFNSGHKYRVGPHDLYVKIATRLASAGLTVIACDPSDAGDDFPGFRHPGVATHQREIVGGSQVAEAIADIRHYRTALGLGAVVASGLCGGTRTAIGAAARCDAVDGVIAWGCPFQIPGLPPLLPRVPEDPLVSEAPPVPAVDATSGPRTDARPWSAQNRARLGRLLRGQIDWQHHRRRLRRRWARLRGRNPSFNHDLADEIATLEERGLPLVMVYSEKDPHHVRFRDYYLPWRESRGAGPPPHVEILRGSNHVVADAAGFARLATICEEFCSRLRHDEEP